MSICKSYFVSWGVLKIDKEKTYEAVEGTCVTEIKIKTADFVLALTVSPRGPVSQGTLNPTKETTEVNLVLHSFHRNGIQIKK